MNGAREGTRQDAAARVLEQKRPAWRNQKHPKDWLTSLERYVFPRIGGRPVGEVTSAVACYFSIVRYENGALVRLTNHITPAAIGRASAH